MIRWTRRSGPVHYQSEDHCYTVQEGYRWGRFGFAAMNTACLSARPLGPIRDTAEEAKDDCDQSESGARTWAQILELLAAEREAAGVTA